jgi:pimeloyl-ACP methyl ester carboxylesterase/DNA-binding CsgD family transcriptional regulator
VLEACGGEPATVFACSCAGLATARLASESPELVRKVVFFGGYVARHDIPEATRRSLVDFVRTNWPLAAQMLAGLVVPRGSGDEIAAVSRYQRHSAAADVAAAFLELDLTSDARAFLPALTMPALVLHRRGDRTVPIGHGRELASLLPNARFVKLSGDSHLPWMDDQREVQRALAGFLDDAVPVDSNGDSPLSRRETEVLRLVAAGLSNREIASSLVLSEHTVHRHVANILRKLAQSTRAAAAAHATRSGLI